MSRTSVNKCKDPLSLDSSSNNNQKKRISLGKFILKLRWIPLLWGFPTRIVLAIRSLMFLHTSIHVSMSQWLNCCTFFSCLVLPFSKQTICSSLTLSHRNFSFFFLFLFASYSILDRENQTLLFCLRYDDGIQVKNVCFFLLLCVGKWFFSGWIRFSIIFID